LILILIDYVYSHILLPSLNLIYRYANRITTGGWEQLPTGGWAFQILRKPDFFAGWLHHSADFLKASQNEFCLDPLDCQRALGVVS
jgi:hypothetical protein